MERLSLLSGLGNDLLLTQGTPALWIGFVVALALAPARSRGPHGWKRWRVQRRRAGRRRALMPSIWGWLAVIVGGALTLFFAWQLVTPTIVPRDEGWKALLAVAAVTLAVSQYWFNVAGRIKAAPATLPVSPASVLYLRAFDEEQRPFAVGPRSVLKHYTSKLSANTPFTRGDPALKLTLEDFLEEAITAQLGSFVALGNPYDRLSPDGATREYAPDEAWQTRFLELAQNARCIVVSIGGSPNLEWELEQITKHGLGQKLCLFTSPYVPGSDTGAINRRRRSETRHNADVAADWSRSREALCRAGFDCDEVGPGPGAAVTFDASGKSVLLTADAATPAEFIAPVTEWFQSGRKSGRCIPVPCRSCSATTYVTQERAADGGTCYVCRNTAARAGLSLFTRYPTLYTLWAIFALWPTVVLVDVWQVEAGWLMVLIWSLFVLLPTAIRSGWRAVARRRARSRGALSADSTV